MKELAMIIAIIQIIPLLGLMAYAVEESNELREFNDIMREGDQEERDDAINNYMHDFKNDLINITIDEVEDLPKEIIMDDK